jgi:RHS repeat-associated protein
LGMYTGGRKEGQRRLGQKNYELSNHLGNVLTVITDNINMSITDGVTATVVSATDYYPFGLEMKGRSYKKPDGVIAPVVSLDFSGTVDPFRSNQVVVNIENGKLKVNAASLYNSTYMVLPTTMGHVYEVKFDVDLAGGGQITAFASDRTNNLAALGVTTNGTYSYQFTATRAETLVIFENVQASGTRDFYLDNLIIKDLSGGANAEDGYRYGFNGKEKDNSFASDNSYDYGFRIYNPQIAKFLSVDPLTNSYPMLTPYQFAGNSPIESIDLDGLERLRVGKDGNFEVYFPSDATSNMHNPAPVIKPQPKKPELSLVNQKQTFVGPDPHQNELASQRKARENRNTLNNAIKRRDEIGKQVNSFMFGGEGFGEGFAKTTAEAFKQAPLLVAQELAIAKVQKLAYFHSLSKAEQQVVGEANTILKSPEFSKIQSAYEAGIATEVNIGGRTVLYEPELPGAGFTLFEENAFVIGKEAFKSQAELNKTVLHELYRLKNSTVKSTGISGASAATETKSAADFAEKTYNALKK